MKRPVKVFAVAVMALAVIVLFFLPGKTLLDQARTISSTDHRIHVLDQENAKLAAEAKALTSPAEIERQARERFGLVGKGEHAYMVVPATVGATTTTTRAPADAG